MGGKASKLLPGGSGSTLCPHEQIGFGPGNGRTIQEERNCLVLLGPLIFLSHAAFHWKEGWAVYKMWDAVIDMETSRLSTWRPLDQPYLCQNLVSPVPFSRISFLYYVLRKREVSHMNADLDLHCRLRAVIISSTPLSWILWPPSILSYLLQG